MFKNILLQGIYFQELHVNFFCNSLYDFHTVRPLGATDSKSIAYSGIVSWDLIIACYN